jgi:nucleoside-diphosphate-sugar epimerase
MNFKMCESLCRRVQITKLILPGSVSRDGLRATDLPRESQGYRDLPRIGRQQTLSHGFPQYDCMFHSADANEPRDWRIYADFAQTLIAIARPLYRCWRQLQDGERPEVEVFGDRYLTPDGTAIRDYVHIIDLADAHVRALNFLQEPGHAEFLNLGTGHGYSVMQVIQAAREITGREIVLASSRLGLEIRRDWSRTTRGQRNCLAGRRHPIFARS